MQWGGSEHRDDHRSYVNCTDPLPLNGFIKGSARGT